MALTRIPNFNRIIDLRFFTNMNAFIGPLQLGEKAPAPKYVEQERMRITCPRRGQKPAIEMTGTMTTETAVPAFNITVKNLYLDIPNSQYPKLQVTAGYEGNYQTFEGSILSMYQESPGPEGRTIIQCLEGAAETWLDTIVDLQYNMDSFKLYDALKIIAQDLNLNLFTTPSVRLMVGKTSLQFRGRAQEAIAKLRSMFEAEQLVISVRGGELRAYSKKDKTGINDVRLSFLTTPPQQHAGSDGIISVILTAPWEPRLRPGDIVTYNTWQFMKRFATSTQKTARIMVDNLQFHFGTVGSVNQMTITGHAV